MRGALVLLIGTLLFAWAMTQPFAPARTGVVTSPFAPVGPFTGTVPADGGLPLARPDLRFVRFAAIPQHSIVYRAARPGHLPAAGTPVVAGIRLPAGHPALRVPEWETRAPVPDAVALARRLAVAFPRTGLWPVLWGANDDPSGYMDGPVSERLVDRIGARSFLAHAWRTTVTGRGGLPAQELSPFGRPFPGLAPGAARPGLAANPFAIFARYRTQISGYDQGPYRLLLAACRRPADALSVVSLSLPEYLTTDPEIAAVLRSWEDRFGARVVLFGTGYVVMTVDSPPRSPAVADRLAGEYVALEQSDSQEGSSDSLRQVGRVLMGDGAVNDQDYGSEADFSAGTWVISYS